MTVSLVCCRNPICLSSATQHGVRRQLMDPQETLNTLAEIAVALAGFAGIMFGLRNRSGGATQEVARLSMTLWVCFSVVTCSLLPIVISQFTERGDLIWGVPCFLLGILQFSNMTTIAILLRERTVAPAFPRLNMVAISMIYISSIVMFAGSFDVLVPRSSGTLMVGCLSGALMGGYSFLSNSTWALRGETDDA